MDGYEADRRIRARRAEALVKPFFPRLSIALRAWSATLVPVLNHPPALGESHFGCIAKSAWQRARANHADREQTDQPTTTSMA